MCKGACAPAASVCVYAVTFLPQPGSEFKWNLGVFSAVWQQAWLTESHDILLFDFALVVKVNC